MRCLLTLWNHQNSCRHIYIYIYLLWQNRCLWLASGWRLVEWSFTICGFVLEEEGGTGGISSVVMFWNSNILVLVHVCQNVPSPMDCKFRIFYCHVLEFKHFGLGSCLPECSFPSGL
ncbi:hypothetical protein GLYMA_17G135700v4 [Glycine max]|uniref:Uncharacterized protein n=1 Tax=Glycine max TaxID=3847 RepID=K7MLH9_SOYBN|nr:hypothetical protein GYH30_047194 [Glycine max]KHN09764.1 hypothetical protein glysoja_017065 [Glycine soja]KRH04040.1 hypothetical protein GLYMA_17G135700v4 [Glycine max]